MIAVSFSPWTKAGAASCWSSHLQTGRSENFRSAMMWPGPQFPAGNQLAFTNSSQNINIWRKDLLHPESAGLKLVASTRAETNPNYSPDGKHIAFESHFFGEAHEIWTSDADGTNLVQISRLNNYATGTPSWSPDGRGDRV